MVRKRVAIVRFHRQPKLSFPPRPPCAARKNRQSQAPRAPRSASDPDESPALPPLSPGQRRRRRASWHTPAAEDRSSRVRYSSAHTVGPARSPAGTIAVPHSATPAIGSRTDKPLEDRARPARHRIPGQPPPAPEPSLTQTESPPAGPHERTGLPSPPATAPDQTDSPSARDAARVGRPPAEAESSPTTPQQHRPQLRQFVPPHRWPPGTSGQPRVPALPRSPLTYALQSSGPQQSKRAPRRHLSLCPAGARLLPRFAARTHSRGHHLGSAALEDPRCFSHRFAVRSSRPRYSAISRQPCIRS